MTITTYTKNIQNAKFHTINNIKTYYSQWWIICYTQFHNNNSDYRSTNSIVIFPEKNMKINIVVSYHIDETIRLCNKIEPKYYYAILILSRMQLQLSHQKQTKSRAGRL